MEDGNALPSCPVEMAPGHSCGEPVVLAAPFPICMTHIGEVYAFAQQAFTWHGRLVRERDQVSAQIPPDGPTVYYLAMSGMIKIGWSANLCDRIRVYMPDHCLLATEPGTLATERGRHAQFDHLRIATRGNSPGRRRELFYPGQDLIEHINGLRQGQGCVPLEIAV